MVTVRPLEYDDEQAALDLRVATFSTAMHVDLADVEVDDYVPADHRVVAEDGGRIVGHLAVWPFAQRFGGRSVPMGGVGGVAVAIDRRGRGIGSLLLAAGLDLMADRGLVVSTLLPSVPLPYRRWGWEVAGDHVRRRLALRELLALPTPPDDVVLRPWSDDDLPALLAVHNAVTDTEPGGLVATERWLRRAEVDDGHTRLTPGGAGRVAVDIGAFVVDVHRLRDPPRDGSRRPPAGRGRRRRHRGLGGPVRRPEPVPPRLLLTCIGRSSSR